MEARTMVTCSACKTRPASYTCQGDGRCAKCAPDRCQACWAFGRPHCRIHRGSNAHAAMRRGFRPELKVIADEHPAFGAVRCETCEATGRLADGRTCQLCGGAGAVQTGDYREHRELVGNDTSEDPTQPEARVVTAEYGHLDGQRVA